MLHIVNKSPFERNALESCLRLAKDGSSVLLYEDGVYGALARSAATSPVAGNTGRVKIYVLGPDLEARGFGADALIDGVTMVDYEGFVDLAADNGPVQSWL